MKKGSVLVGILMILVTLMTLGVVLSSIVLTHSRTTQRQYKVLSALTYAEAGINKGLFEINNNNLSYASTTSVLDSSLVGGEFRVLIESCGTDCKLISSTGFIPTEAKAVAKKKVRVKINSVVSMTNLVFNYSAQSNANQIDMANGSKIIGSAYSNGPIYMSNNTTITKNATSYGTSPSNSYISGGNGAKIQGNANAYTITPSSGFVTGTKTTGSYPASQNPPIAPEDIETTIDAWEATATAGGVTTGNVTYSGTNNVLGPRQINGDLTVTNNSELKLTGNVWVNGNINVSNNAKIYLDSSFGTNSAIMIADYKSNRADWTKGLINLSNNVTISGIDKNNPKTSSFIMMFSTQSPMAPAEPTNWKTYPAITVSNNIHGGMYYAPFGSYKQSNVAQIRAVVASGLVLDNNATLDYDPNWGNSGITTGPAGKWTITEWLILE